MKTKFLLFSLMLSLLSITNVWAEKLTVGTNGATWSNGVKTPSAQVGDVLFTALGSGSNDSKYYSSDKSWRFYTANTSGVRITVPEGNKITSVVLTWKTGQPNTPTGWARDKATSPTTYTPNSGTTTNTVDFTRNSSNNFLAQVIEVTYEPTGGGSVAVESVTLDESAITLTEEETQTLTAIVLPADATNKNVTWESDDEDVATVSNTGVVTAVGAGDATITCKSVSDNTKSATCAVHVNVSPYTKSSLIFTKACGGSGTADDDAVWTVTSDANESNYDNTKGIHYGTGSAAVSYIKIQTDEIAGTIAKVVVNTSGASGTSAVVSVSVDGTAFEIYGDKPSASITTTASDYTFTGSASGTILVSITQTSNTKAIYCKSIIVYYEAPAPAAVATPTFTPAAGTYTAAQSVTLNCETTGASIYYTTDGSVPSSSSTLYNGAISLSERGAYSIKAIAIKGSDESTVATATYTINLPFASVAELFSYLEAHSLTTLNDVTVTGYVSEIVTPYSTQYSNITFNISDDGSTTAAQLQSYRGKGTEASSIEVGDKVTISGNYKVHNETKELDQNNTITNRVAKGSIAAVAVSGTPTKTVYANGETFEPAGLDVTATYANGFATAVTADSWECTPATVTASGNISVKATYESVQSLAYSVPVTVASKTLVSIALSYDAVDVYQGLELPKPIVTATYSEGQPEDVTAQAEFTGYDASTTGEQEITVSYTFGGTTKTATYTVTVNPIFNVELAASVARNLIINVVGNTESTDDMIIRGKVSYINNASSNAQTYWISDDGTRTNEVEIFKGKYLSGADFTSANQLRVGDEVVVIGKVIYYNNSTPEFANGKSEVQSLARTPNFAITDVTEFEVGATDLGVADLTVTVEGEGAITLVSGDETKATIVSNAIHAVAPGTVTITANLAADGIYKAATTTFNVTVIATQTKYAVSFDGNGADGGTAPEAIANQVEGASVTLPENTWTKTNKLFDGWKVINNTTFAEITVTAGAFTMPASTVTIQAQWADPSVWALTYTSNLTLTGNSSTKAYAEKVKITVNEVLTEFDALRACTGSAAGSCTVTVPAGTQKLHFHAAAWNAKTSTITVTMGETELLVQALAADAGIKNSSPYTLEGIPYMYYYCIDLSSYTLSDETTITFAAGSDKRFVLFGVNQEGGVVPVLQSIAIDGDMTNKTGYKAGDQLDMAGLTVSATYTLGGTAQTPVDITNDPGLSWTYDPIVEGQTSVTVTANFGGETAEKTIIGLEVASADPKIYVSSTKAEFGTVAPNATVNPIAITVTLTNVAAATATLGGTNPTAFSIDKTALTASGDITISVVSTATEGSYSATLTISDDATENPAQSKVVNISLKVETTETPVRTASRWEVATASDIADGLEVLITGVKSGTTYAMGSQTNNNRTAIEASIDNEGVLTPGEGTMSFTLEAQGDNYALRTSNGKYLYAASSSSNNLKTEDELDDKGNGLWTITYENNEWSIVAQGDHTRNIMRFNESSIIFSCYSSGQKAIKLYKKAPVAPEVVDVTGSEAVSNIPEGSDVTVEDGGELTVDTKNTFAKLIVKEGGKVTLSNTKQLTVTGTFTIETTMAGGKSGQLKGATQSNFIAQADAYIDITLGDNGNADKWHAFTVPFPVDALNGIFDLNGNKLVNETNYAIMDYHGDIRAQGKYGWKKFRGTLVPGTFYLMTVDGLRTTYRMKMKAGSNVVADNKKDFYKYAASGEGQATDAGWNGIGNPTLAYGQVNVAVQVLDPVNYVYVTKNANSCNFIVGTPFFYQAAGDGHIAMEDVSGTAYYAPIRKAVKTTEQIKVSLANEKYTDNLFISASEDATADYQVGKDLVKMTMTNTPIVPQIFGVAYKTQLSMVHAPLVGDRATYTLNLYAPADGEYTISAQQTEDAIVYLTYEGSPIWNITAGEYNCDLQKGNNSGFGLMLVRHAPQVTTDIEGANQSQNSVRKLLINGQLFIEKEGKLFNVTGQRL